MEYELLKVNLNPLLERVPMNVLPQPAVLRAQGKGPWTDHLWVSLTREILLEVSLGRKPGKPLTATHQFSHSGEFSQLQ